MGILDTLFRGNHQSRTIMRMLDTERENYVGTYLRGISDAKAAHELAVPEVKVEMSNVPEPYRYYTLDIMCRDGDKAVPIEVNLKIADPFEPISENWQGLQVTLHPFVWNGLEFRLDGDLSDDSPLVDWFMRWMDFEDQKPKDANLLSQIVHNVTPPARTQNGWTFAVDFGTAPIDSFVELVELIRKAGTNNLELGSFSYGAS